MWFDGRIAPVSNDIVVFVARDITERKQFEVQLNNAKEAAEAANRAKSDFLSNMSHELRTPLNAILGFTELVIRNPGLSTEQLDNLITIRHSGEYLLSLINDVLEFSKIEAGRIVLHKENFDLHQLLLGLEDMFQLRVHEKRLYLNFELGENIPRYIRTDQNKLRQILINLLGNAVKFTEAGGITLIVVYRGIKNKAQRTICSLYFEIVDTGIGISNEEREKVFDLFSQINSKQYSQQGTGLGLPISRRFVSMLGGSLKLDSKLNKGTTFSFDISVELADSTDQKLARPTRRVTGLVEGQAIFRLLVVDDNKTNRNLMVRLLQIVGFEVQGAENGQEAVAIWEKWQPHLIWMDLRMPVMDGFEAIRQIRFMVDQNDTIGQPIIIALTASVFEEEKAIALSKGCDDFVRKPFKEEEIFEKMRIHIGVQYIYEERKYKNKIYSKKKLSKNEFQSAINAVPIDLLNILQKATELSDVSMISEVINNIRAQNSKLAERLDQYAMNFDYDTILNAVREAKKK